MTEINLERKRKHELKNILFVIFNVFFPLFSLDLCRFDFFPFEHYSAPRTIFDVIGIFFLDFSLEVGQRAIEFLQLDGEYAVSRVVSALTLVWATVE